MPPRARLAALAVGIAAALTLPVPASREVTASPPRQPVVFVHGAAGGAHDWEALSAVFEAEGYAGHELRAWAYDWRQDNRVTARLLAEEVHRVLTATGADRVDLVTFSMGALPSRWYLARLGGTHSVDAWVSLGGPNAGSVRGFGCDDPSCHDRRWGSDLIRELAEGDRTPGAVRYATWWSPCDEVLDPDTTVLLPGATNTRTSCLGHAELLRDPGVARQVLEFVRDGPGPAG